VVIHGHFAGLRVVVFRTKRYHLPHYRFLNVVISRTTVVIYLTTSGHLPDFRGALRADVYRRGPKQLGGSRPGGFCVAWRGRTHLGAFSRVCDYCAYYCDLVYFEYFIDICV